MNLYRIHGKVTHNQCEETEDGFSTVEIDELIEAENAIIAFEIFLHENPQLEFFGSLKEIDADTQGTHWAKFRDSNEGQTVIIEIED